MTRFTRSSLLTLAALLGAGMAQAQVGLTSAGVLNQAAFSAAKRGAAGTYTFADGASVVLNERSGYLLSALVVVPSSNGPTPTAQKITAASGTAQAQGTLPPATPGLSAASAARAAELVGVLTGQGAGIAQPMTQFLAREDVQKALPAGINVGADPYALNMKTEGKTLKVTVALPQADSSKFAPTTNALAPKKATSKPVVMRVYSDFQCPYCLKFETETMPGLLAKLPDDVRIEFHQFPLEQIHPLARASAEASECAAQQGKFWAYKDALFDDRTWLSGNPNTVFIALAGKVGAKTDTFKSCLAERGGKAAVDAGLKEALALGVNGTPTVFVGNYKVANPYDVNGLLKQIQFVRAVGDTSSPSASPVKKP